VVLFGLTKEIDMFYVYVYKDPRPTSNRRVVYVGKGTGERKWDHWRKPVHKNKGFGNFLALLRRDKLEPIVEVVLDNLDEASAFVEEMRLIEFYGRRDLKTGYLFNLTDGGEGLANAVRTPEWVENIRVANSTPEQKSRNAQAASKRWADPEYRLRTTEAIRKALKDPEVIRRREEGKAAFIHTDEFRETMRNATTKMWQNEEYVKKTVQSQKNAQSTPEARILKSQISTTTWSDPSVREKRVNGIKSSRNTEESKAKTSAQSRAQWDNPEYASKQRANNKEIANREEVKAAKSAASKAMWADPVKRAKILETKRLKRIARANP
jgi:hypothetical protein